MNIFKINYYCNDNADPCPDLYGRPDFIGQTFRAL